MATVDANELEDAVLLVSGPGDVVEAWVCLDTGAVYLRGDSIPEEAGPLPENIDTSDRLVGVPDARHLDLGQQLVFAFAGTEMPDAYDHVRQMFRRPGAYRHFSRLVEDRGLRDRRHAFRQERTIAALREWCEENGLELGA